MTTKNPKLTAAQKRAIKAEIDRAESDRMELDVFAALQHSNPVDVETATAIALAVDLMSVARRETDDCIVSLEMLTASPLGFDSPNRIANICAELAIENAKAYEARSVASALLFNEMSIAQVITYLGRDFAYLTTNRTMSENIVAKGHILAYVQNFSRFNPSHHMMLRRSCVTTR